MFEIRDIQRITDLIDKITRKIRHILDENIQIFPFSTDLETGWEQTTVTGVAGTG